MGSIKAANPIHYISGVEYRRLIRRLNALINLAKENSEVMGVKQRHDVLLAKKAVLASVYLSNSGAGTLPYARNATGKDYAKLAYNKIFFGASFDAQMREYQND